MGKVIDMDEHRRRKMQKDLSFEQFCEKTLEQIARALGLSKDLLKGRE